MTSRCLSAKLGSWRSFRLLLGFVDGLRFQKLRYFANMAASFDINTCVTFNDGVRMPLFGLGVYRLESGATAEQAILYALKNGYRLIDTAQLYENEADVGKSVKKSGIPREEICIVTKVWDSNHGYNKTIQSAKKSLSLLGLDYVDVFLIHSPNSGLNVETYKALHELKENGLIKSVGVSNFGIQHLKGLEESGLPTPSVNQIELHPFCKRDKLAQYCKEKGIAVMGYSPLARCKRNDDPDLTAIAQRHHKTVAQIMIRWSLEKGFITIPKSSNPVRIQENSEVFNFNLTEDDHKILESKPDNFVVSWDPTTSPWRG